MVKDNYLTVFVAVQDVDFCSSYSLLYRCLYRTKLAYPEEQSNSVF